MRTSACLSVTDYADKFNFEKLDCWSENLIQIFQSSNNNYEIITEGETSIQKAKFHISIT